MSYFHALNNSGVGGGGGLGPVFDPRAISNCTIWLSANNLSLSDNTSMGTWANAATAGGNWAGSNNPKFRTGIKNGFPAINFVAASGQRFAGNLAISNYINASAYTLFFVVRPTAGGTSGSFNGTNLLVNGGGWVGVTAGGNVFNHWHDAPTGGANVAFTTGNWYIVEAHYNGTAVKIRVNGGTEASTNVGAVGNVGTTTFLGCNYTGSSNFFDGYIADIAGFNVDLNSTDLATVRDGYNAMYAVY